MSNFDAPEMMRKEEAAQYVGCSVRSLENYTKQGKISVKYEKGKTRPVAMYPRAELDGLKSELEATIYAPAVMPSEREGSETHALAKRTASVDVTGMLAQLINAAQANATERERPHVPIEAKLVLNLKEAQALTGFSRADLLEAVEAGKLKAKKTGRGWKMKRSALDTYIEKSF